MVNKKLAALLATAVVLGQAGLVTTLLANAETQLTPPQKSDLLQVASVIEHSELTGQSDTASEDTKKPSTPDIYTIDNGVGALPTLIQVLPQDHDTTSLFVNGTEILRFNGEAANMSSYTRVKTIANKLNSLLVRNPKMASQIHPALLNGEAVIQVGGETLATVNTQTAKTAQEGGPELSILYSNRLRQVLGANPLSSKELATVAHNDDSHYKGTGRVQKGMASWYGGVFHGRRAADGSRFNMYALTAAHRSLPFGTVVRVVNQRNHKSCMVKITDRGPYAHGRIIDLSRGAAKAIGMLGSGVAKVSLEVVNNRG